MAVMVRCPKSRVNLRAKILMLLVRLLAERLARTEAEVVFRLEKKNWSLRALHGLAQTARKERVAIPRHRTGGEWDQRPYTSVALPSQQRLDPTKGAPRNREAIAIDKRLLFDVIQSLP